jgi:hypothetical protein
MTTNKMKSPEELRQFYAEDYVDSYEQTHTPGCLANPPRDFRLLKDDCAVDFGRGSGIVFVHAALAKPIHPQEHTEQEHDSETAGDKPVLAVLRECDGLGR